MWKQNTQPPLALVGLHERAEVSCPKRRVNHLWKKDISFVSNCVLEGKFKKYMDMETWWSRGLRISNIIWKPDRQTQPAKHKLGLLFVCDMTLCAAWQVAAPELRSGWWHLEEAAALHRMSLAAASPAVSESGWVSYAGVYFQMHPNDKLITVVPEQKRCRRV